MAECQQVPVNVETCLLHTVLDAGWGQEEKCKLQTTTCLSVLEVGEGVVQLVKGGNEQERLKEGGENRVT